MIPVPKRWEQWGRTLVGGAISGGASSVLAALGISAASAMGVLVKPLDLNQMRSVFISGALVGAMMFLVKSPVPPEATDDSSTLNTIQNPNSKDTTTTTTTTTKLPE